jgi:hypothetical protein
MIDKILTDKSVEVKQARSARGMRNESEEARLFVFRSFPEIAYFAALVLQTSSNFSTIYFAFAAIIFKLVTFYCE